MFPAPKSRKAQQEELKAATKFLVVRHPFDRIISAYKGKIAKPDAKPRFYRRLQKEIKKKYGEIQEEIDSGVPPSFREYWRYLIDLTSGLERAKDWRSVDCVQSYYSMCFPCDVEYDLILKLESHSEDTEFLIRERQLKELMEPFTMWKHDGQSANQIGDYDYYIYEEEYRNPKHFAKNNSPESSETNTTDILEQQMKLDGKRKVIEKFEYKKSLFSQLSESDVKRLYENYKVDFEMFDYNISEFLKFTNTL